MKEEHKELEEDVLDEEKAIEETLERLSNVRIKFNSKVKLSYRASNGDLFDELL